MKRMLGRGRERVKQASLDKSLNAAGVAVLSSGCPSKANGFTLDAAHCGQLVAGSLPVSFAPSATVLQGRILDFGLGVRW